MEDTTLLRLENVDICREENVILHNASFHLKNGEFVYVIGKVGSDCRTYRKRFTASWYAK